MDDDVSGSGKMGNRPGKRLRRAWVVLAVVLAAWGWYRGTLHWRAASERDRLEALAGPVPEAVWRSWGDVQGIGPVRNLITGERELHRLEQVRMAVHLAEQTPAAR